MSQSTDIPLTGSTALKDSAHTVSRSVQHAIPRFLLKLYEIVNDPENEALVKWSDAGDSFFIINQERLTREVLGKWFKHQNFSSFVRQLNLYGFRKITCLQQGLLRTDLDNDTIQFAHPHFRRGQPDLLALIQRKRNPPSHAHAENNAVSVVQPPLPSSNPNEQSQSVDIHSIIDGINAIRRQQQAIASDLSALKQSNDALWKEAIEARERHSTHEDTINRILKFLAGVFGGVIQGRVDSSGNPMIPSRRLQIEDRHPSLDVGSDTDAHSDTGSIASERFATVETPMPSVGPPTPAIHEIVDANPPFQPASSNALSNQRIPDVHSVTGVATNTPSLTLSTAHPNSIPESLWNTTLQQLLTSPTHCQNLLQSFTNSQTSNCMAAPSEGQQMVIAPPPLLPTSTPTPTNPTNPLAIETITPSTVYPQQDTTVLHDASQIQKAYHDMHEINEDVNDLQINIETLIRDMGLDPDTLSFPSGGNLQDNVSTIGGHMPQDSEFSFDTWLNQLSNPSVPDQDEATDDFSTFLNIPPVEQQSSFAPGPDITPSLSSTELSPSGMKRKMELAVPEDDGPSSKRKR